MSADDMLIASKEIFALINLKHCLLEIYGEMVTSEDNERFNNAISLLDLIWDLEIKIAEIDE